MRLPSGVLTYALQVWIESSKMEVEIRSPVSGICVERCVNEGDLLSAQGDIAVIIPG